MSSQLSFQFIPQPQGQQGQNVQNLKSVWDEMRKCILIVVSNCLSNGYSYLKKRYDVRYILCDFESWLWVYILTRARDISIWISLVQNGQWISLQKRVKWMFQNYIRELRKEMKEIYIEDLTKPPRAATREVFNGFDPFTTHTEEVNYDEK